MSVFSILNARYSVINNLHGSTCFNHLRGFIDVLAIKAYLSRMDFYRKRVIRWNPLFITDILHCELKVPCFVQKISLNLQFGLLRNKFSTAFSRLAVFLYATDILLWAV